MNKKKLEILAYNIVYMYKQGFTTQRIVELLGWNESVVKSILTTANNVVRMYIQSGSDIPEIAKANGWSTSLVESILTLLGVIKEKKVGVQ